MTRKIFGKVMWVGRTAATVFGLALVLALVFGVATTAIGATGGKFILGKANAATTVSKLTASIAGPALTLVNNSTNAAATALNISVASGQAPLKVNEAAGTATNLSADKLDGYDATAFQSRVSEECPPGQSIRAIGEDGSATCEPDDGGGKATDSELLDGRDSTSFASVAHAHTGTDITTGAVPEARIDSAVARDSEIMPVVKSNDGAGSGVDADQLDGKNSTEFATQAGLDSEANTRASADHGLGTRATSLETKMSVFNATEVIDNFGSLPRQTTYTSKGGTLLISASGSGYRNATNDKGRIGMAVKVDGTVRGNAMTFTNERNSHETFVADYIVVKGLAAGQHTIALESMFGSLCNTSQELSLDYCTLTNNDDNFRVTILEIPA